jgi:hypothetical protein
MVVLLIDRGVHPFSRGCRGGIFLKMEWFSFIIISTGLQELEEGKYEN